jgi:hypothetical protein
MRCKICQPIIIADIRGGMEIEHQPSFIALKESAESGCDICTLIYTRLTDGRSPGVIAELLKGHAYGREEDTDTTIRLRGFIYDIGKSTGRENRLWVMTGKYFEHGPYYNSVSAELCVYAESG